MSFKTKEDAQSYWNKNVSLMIKLMVVWFVVSFGCGILFVDQLNAIQLGGYKLGFWFAQQGAIYTFVFLTFFYAKKMGDLDREYGVDDE